MRSVFIASLALLAACSQKSSHSAEPEAATPFNSAMDVHELMVHVMQPAAYGFWNGWGNVITEEGVIDISPRTEAEWKRVEDGAATIVIATNTLLLPAFQREPKADWIASAKAVADIAIEGKAAAEAQDKKAMQDFGERLDAACDVCHEKFQPEQKKMN